MTTDRQEERAFCKYHDGYMPRCLPCALAEIERLHDLLAQCHPSAAPAIQIQACRPEDRAMANTPEGQAMLNAVAKALAAEPAPAETKEPCICPSCGKPAVRYQNEQGTTIVECECFADAPPAASSPSAGADYATWLAEKRAHNEKEDAALVAAFDRVAAPGIHRDPQLAYTAFTWFAEGWAEGRAVVAPNKERGNG